MNSIKRVKDSETGVKASYANLSELDSIARLRESNNPKDKELLQVIDHYKKVIASQRNQIAILSHQLRKKGGF